MLSEMIIEINKNYTHYIGLVSTVAVEQLNKEFESSINGHEYMLMLNAITETRKYCVVMISTEVKLQVSTIQNQKT